MPHNGYGTTAVNVVAMRNEQTDEMDLTYYRFSMRLEIQNRFLIL